MSNDRAQEMTVAELLADLNAKMEARKTAQAAQKSALTRTIKQIERELDERGIDRNPPAPEPKLKAVKAAKGEKAAKNGRSELVADDKLIAASKTATDAVVLVKDAGYASLWDANPRNRFLIRRRIVAMVKAGQLDSKFLSREERPKKVKAAPTQTDTTQAVAA